MQQNVRLVIHIGQGKTGSTSIQNALRSNPETLSRYGVYYPNSGRHTNHQDIFTYLTGDVKHHDPALGGPRDDARKLALGRSFWEEAVEQISKTETQLVVLSCENQFRPLSAEALVGLSKTLRALFSDVTVVAYLRDPAEHFLSMAQQDVKKRPDISIPTETALRDVLLPWMMYGPGPMKLVRFAKETLENGDVVADFCARCLPFGADELIVPANRDNETISAEAMSILQDYHRGLLQAPTRYHAARAQRMKELVRKADAAVPGFQKPRLLEGIKEAIEARAQDFDWLEAEFGISFPGQDRSKMSLDAARARLSGIDGVQTICHVDQDRRTALLQRIASMAGEKRGLMEKLLASFQR